MQICKYIFKITHIYIYVIFMIYLQRFLGYEYGFVVWDKIELDGRNMDYVTIHALWPNLVGKCTWIQIKPGKQIQHEEKIMWCKFRNKCTYRLFFLFIQNLGVFWSF